MSLSNVNVKEFLREIRKRDPRIRDYITSYMCFIKLIYCFRELVIHREGLKQMGFEYISNKDIWKANFIYVSEEIKNYIKYCGGSKSKLDPFTEWGLYIQGSSTFLEPYHFSMNAINMLIEFVDKYLELLGYRSFIDDQKQRNDNFARILTTFEKFKIGF